MVCDVCLYMHIAGKSLWELVVEQFEDLMVRILLLAACVSFVSTRQLIKMPLNLILFVLNPDFQLYLREFDTQIGYFTRKLPHNRLLCFRQRYAPVRTLFNLVCGPFSCGNLCIKGFSIQCWYGFREGNRQSTCAELERKLSIRTPCAASNCDPGWSPRVVKVEEGWSRESWLHNNIFFFHLLQHLPGVSGWNCCCYFWK